MQLIIGGKTAALKKGSSFDYVLENRAFSDADDYTLSITLPLVDCPQNLDIFGHLDRKDIDSRSVMMEASIIDKNFSRHGIITVVECTETDIKCQFLEGRSVQNFRKDFDEIYINSLSLGSYPTTTLPSSPATYLQGYDDGATQVALPWINDNAASVINNCIEKSDNALVWGQDATDMGGLSFQPYLIVIAKRICTAIGYTYDFTAWESSKFRNLIICNTLPATWDIHSYARALPHWSVTQFFEELEKLMVAEIDINHKEKKISIAFCEDMELRDVECRIEKPVDKFTAEVSYKDSLCQYKGVANVRYKECSYSKWKYQQCQWLVDMLKGGSNYKEFETELEWYAWCADNFGALGIVGIVNKTGDRGQKRDYLFHVKETDVYYLFQVVYGNMSQYPNMYFITPMTVNQFGNLVNDKDNDQYIELNFAPVCIDATDYDHGDAMFLSFSSYDETEKEDDAGITQPVAYSMLQKGEKDGEAEYYDRIYVAFFSGWSSTTTIPCPTLTGLEPKTLYSNYLKGIKIDPRHRVKFTWIADTIPSPRSCFFVEGKWYLCEKITATFTEFGRSQLLKGEFYPLLNP